IDLAAAVKKEVMLHAVRRSAQAEAPFAQGFGEFTIHIAVGAHLYGGPIGDAAVIHGEAIVVFKDGNDVPGASGLKELGPLDRIEMLGFETRNEILVTERRGRAIRRKVVFIFSGPLLVHHARIPLAAKGRDGINAPMDKDAKLGVLVPIRGFVLAK